MRPLVYTKGCNASAISLTKVFKSGSCGFPLPLWIMGIALRLVRQCQDNGLINCWLKIVQETGICELSPLNN